ncbi:MAG: ABC transporter permease subunit, partial [Nitrospinota bacterium]
ILFSLVLNEYSRLSFEAIRSNQMFKMEGLTVAEGILRPIFSSTAFLMLLIMPLLTMKSFSEEKKSGAIEILFTYPISGFALVVGKFMAAVTVFAVMLAFTASHYLMVLYFKPVPLGEMFTGYLGLFLMGTAFISLGVFISSLTENQVIAAAWSFGMIMAFWLVGWLAGDSREPIAEIIRYLSIFKHFESFASGIIDTRDVIYYLSFSGLFIFSTLRVIESKRWRS